MAIVWPGLKYNAFLFPIFLTILCSAIKFFDFPVPLSASLSSLVTDIGPAELKIPIRFSILSFVFLSRASY